MSPQHGPPGDIHGVRKPKKDLVKKGMRKPARSIYAKRSPTRARGS